MFTCRDPELDWKAIADPRLDPCLQNAGLSWSRICDAVQILPLRIHHQAVRRRPRRGNGFRSPIWRRLEYLGGLNRGVPGFDGIGTSVKEFFTGSRIVSKSVLSSWTP